MANLNSINPQKVGIVCPKEIQDNNSCSVYALACLACVSYEVAFNALQQAGRRTKRGATVSTIIEASNTLGLKLKRIEYATRTYNNDWNSNRFYKNIAPCLTKVKEQYKTGWYLLITRNHAFALVDGVIYDCVRTGSKSKIMGMFQVVFDN